MKIDRVFTALGISATGLSVQRKRMNAIASNMANVETTRTEQGGPFRRKVIIVKEQALESFARVMNGISMPLEQTNAHHLGGAVDSVIQQNVGGAVQAEEVEDSSAFKLVHDPTHPDADADGYVKMPNINVVTEMVDMISATRAYEANVTAINAAKNIAKDSLDI